MKRTSNISKNIFLISVFAILNCYSAFSQSDTPCGTTPITLGTSCVYTTHNSSADTKGYEGGTPTCGSYTNAIVEEDFWYSFVVPAGGSVNLSLNKATGSTYDYAGMAVYSGTCSSLTQTNCYSSYGAATMPHFELTGLTPGTTYYVRVWGMWVSSPTEPKTIDFCAYIPPTPPSNDECVNAIPVTVNSDEYCNSLTSGTITGATASSQTTFCPYGVNANDDVWFSFVATNTLLYFHLLNIVGATTDLAYSLHTGPCSSTNLGLCNDGLGGLFNNLIVGNTYYLRIFSAGATAGSATFDLCITQPPVMPSCASNPAPGNTVCTATPICNLNGYCGTTSGTYTIDSWPQLGSAFCAQIDNNSFLSFTAEASTISFYVWTTSSTTGAGIQIFIFSANNCSSGPVNSYSCWNPGSANSIALPVSASGLTVGEEYYIMIDGQAGDIADYTIAAFQGFQMPVEASSVNGDTSICLGQSIDLQATGGNGTYVWSPGTDLNSTTGDIVTSTPTTTGSVTYSVTSPITNPQCPVTSDDFTFTVTSFVTGTDIQTACGSFTWIDGATYTANNSTATHNIVNGSVSGCDSIVTLNLTVSNPVTGTDTQVACGSFTWINGVTYTANNSTATHTIIGGSVNGCDSTATLNLTISSTVTGTDTQIACGSYTWIDGVTYTSTNTTATHTIVAGSVNGCDSTVTLNLSISNSTTGTDTQVACGSFTWIDGISYTTSNTSATHTIIGGSVNGCDSTVTLNLTISNAISGVDTQVACGSFTWIDGITYSTNNTTATHTIVGGSTSGCDSIVTLNLTISNSVTGVDTQVACGSFTWIDGITYSTNNTTATHTIVGGSTFGCDSIVTLNLTISNSVTGTDTQVACGSFTWIDGVTYSTNNTTATHTIVGGSFFGCDSILTLNLTISNSVTGTDTKVACGSYTWIDGVTYTSSNNSSFYTLAGGSVSGCDSIITLNLTISPDVMFNLGEDKDICDESIVLSPGNGFASYQWSTGSTDPEITINTDGSYSVTVIDFNGCVGSDTIRIVDDCEFSIWVPNAFTPDGDQFNQTFLPVISVKQFESFIMYIYNRWGEIVFESHDINAAWDGTYRGQYVEDGVYIWKIIFKHNQGDQKQEYIGHVTILK